MTIQRKTTERSLLGTVEVISRKFESVDEILSLMPETSWVCSVVYCAAEGGSNF